eukprot:2102766-Rhodomonas_salina.2
MAHTGGSKGAGSGTWDTGTDSSLRAVMSCYRLAPICVQHETEKMGIRIGIPTALGFIFRLYPVLSMQCYYYAYHESMVINTLMAKLSFPATDMRMDTRPGTFPTHPITERYPGYRCTQSLPSPRYPGTR